MGPRGYSGTESVQENPWLGGFDPPGGVQEPPSYHYTINLPEVRRPVSHSHQLSSIAAIHWLSLIGNLGIKVVKDYIRIQLGISPWENLTHHA